MHGDRERHRVEVWSAFSSLEAGQEVWLRLGPSRGDEPAGAGMPGVLVGDLLALGDRAVVQVTAHGKEGSQGAGGPVGPMMPPAAEVLARVLIGGVIAAQVPVRLVRPSRDLAVVVLAGGRSTRFGSDKRRADLGDGRTLLEAAVDVAREVSRTVFLSVGFHEATLGVPGVVTVPDRVPDTGPLGGLAASLRVCQAPLVLAFAVDQPGVTADLLRVLAGRREGPGCFLRRGEDLHPLPCCLTRAVVLPVLESALASGRRALHKALVAAGLVSLDVASLSDLGPPEALLANLNDPREAACFREQRLGAGRVHD